MAPRQKNEAENDSETICSSEYEEDHLNRSSSNHVNYSATNNEITISNAKVVSIDDAIEQLGMGTFQWYLLVAAGLCFAADSMEVLLLSFLAIVVQIEWGLQEEQTSFIISTVFAGAMLGTLVLGYLGDKLGRKPIFIVTSTIIAVFGFATAFVTSYEYLICVRFLVGFGVGGLHVPFDTLAEFVPSSHRGSNLLIIEYFWSLGTILVPLFAYFTLGEGGSDGSWRLFVFLCAIPCALSAILAITFVPESPRWLLAKGKDKEAIEILRQAAVINGKDPMLLFPEGVQVIDDNPEEEEATVCDLFSPQWLSVTLNLWGVWLSFAILYYGAIIVTTQVFESAPAADLSDDTTIPDQGYHFDYWAIFISACSEVVGLTIVIYTVDKFGRIPSQIASYFFGGIMILLLSFLASSEDVPRIVLVLLAFLSRMFMMGGSCTTWVSTAEILTTEVRTTGHSWANAFARMGGFVVPFVVGESTPLSTIGITFLVVGIFASVCTWNLPETKGAALGSSTSQKDLDTIRPSSLCGKKDFDRASYSILV